MEYKFKVGDEVERTDDFSSEMPLGSRWIVVGYNYGGWLNLEGSVNTDGQYHGWEQLNFKLISKAEDVTKGIKGDNSISSDGGSSDYYFTKLPKHLIDEIVKTGGIEIKDIARYVYDNDADAFNIIKAEKRIIENRKGVGKKGVTSLYDANKIMFFAKEQYEAMRKDDVDCVNKKEDNK